MRVAFLLCCLLILAGCAVRRPASTVALTSQESEQLKKHFQGTLLDKRIQEFDKPASAFGESEHSVYVQLTVASRQGISRRFYDFTADKSRMLVLREYFKELQKGDEVDIDLGLIDDNSATEEPFETVRRISR